MKDIIEAIGEGHELLQALIDAAPPWIEPKSQRKKKQTTPAGKGTPSEVEITYPDMPGVTVVKDFDSLGAAKRFINENNCSLRSRVKKDGKHYIKVIGAKGTYFIT